MGVGVVVVVVVVKKRTSEGSFSNEKYPYFQYNIMILWYENAFRITVWRTPFTRIFDVFFVVSLNKHLIKHTSCWWRSCDITVFLQLIKKKSSKLRINITLCGEPGVGVTKGPFVDLSATNFWQYKMICQNLHIMFIFGRCHRSVAAVTPVKFEHDMKYKGFFYNFETSWENYERRKFLK